MPLPVLLSPPSGRPARVLGDGPRTLPAVQSLLKAGWPVVVHGGELANLPGVTAGPGTPPTPSLRQASMVLIGKSCPGDLRAAALKALEGSGIPLWDEASPERSTLRFPLWLHGQHLSMASWGPGRLASWQASLAQDFLDTQEALFRRFAALMDEVGGLAFKGAADETFLKKAVSQLSTPDILALLAKGEEQKARMLALRIVGSTTRSLEE